MTTCCSLLQVQHVHLLCLTFRRNHFIKQHLDVHILSGSLRPHLHLAGFCVEISTSTSQFIDETFHRKVGSILLTNFVILTTYLTIGAEEINSTKEHLVATRTINTMKAYDTIANGSLVLVCCDLYLHVRQLDVQHRPCTITCSLPVVFGISQFRWIKFFCHCVHNTTVKVTM